MDTRPLCLGAGECKDASGACAGKKNTKIVGVGELRRCNYVMECNGNMHSRV